MFRRFIADFNRDIFHEIRIFYNQLQLIIIRTKTSFNQLDLLYSIKIAYFAKNFVTFNEKKF